MPFSSFFARFANTTVIYVPDIKPGTGDDFLITDDQAPNSSGCKLLGINEVDADQAKGMIDSGTYETLVILQEDLVGRGIASTESLTPVFQRLSGYQQQFYLTQRVCHHTDYDGSRTFR